MPAPWWRTGSRSRSAAGYRPRRCRGFEMPTEARPARRGTRDGARMNGQSRRETSCGGSGFIRVDPEHIVFQPERLDLDVRHREPLQGVEYAPERTGPLQLPVPVVAAADGDGE